MHERLFGLAADALPDVIESLQSGAPLSRLASEGQEVFSIGNLPASGEIVEISEQMWDYFWESCETVFACGNAYAVAVEDLAVIRLFWRRGPHCFSRQLTQKESRIFCAAADITRTVSSGS